LKLVAKHRDIRSRTFMMVDRVYNDHHPATFQESASTYPSSNVTLSLDGLYRDNTHLLNMVASGVTLPFNFGGSNNNNIQDLLTAATNKLQGLQQQNMTMDTMNSLSHAALLSDLKRKIIRLSSSTQAQMPQEFGLYRNENTTGIALQDNRQSLLLHDDLTNKVSLSNKRSFLSSFATDDEPSTKKIYIGETKIYSTDMVLPLSVAERKASFPLPPIHGTTGEQQVQCIKLLPSKSSSSTVSLKNLWDKYEKISDDMDDTVADQQAFVKKLFILSLNRSSSHVIEKKMKHLKKLSSSSTAKIVKSKQTKKKINQSTINKSEQRK
jgi:hypothetical protein